MSVSPDLERNSKICVLREQGLTLRAIAARYGLSHDRVRQITFIHPRQMARHEAENTPQRHLAHMFYVTLPLIEQAAKLAREGRKLK